MKKLLLTFIIVFLPLILLGQESIEIKGSVLEDDTGMSLPGVNIIEKGTTNGTMTDFNGNYAIEVPEDAILKVSYIGYVTQEIEVNGRIQIDIVLKQDADALDEVVVVGYGKQSKISMVGSVSTMKPDKLRTPSTNITSNLAGNLSGVIGVQRSGQPGVDGANFFIRGISTYSGAQNPLILLDGVEISAGDLDNLTPEIIESISVLKDATATAVYGSQGANGVLIVTTKEGLNLEKPRIYARAQTTVSSPTTTQSFVDGVDYMNLYNEAVTARRSGERLYSQDKIQGTAENRNQYIFPNVDWYNELFKSSAINQEANVNIRGGGENVGYFMSATFNHETGLLKDFDVNSFNNNIDIRRFNFQNNLNADLSPTTKISLKLNTALNYTDGSAIGAQYSYANTMNTNPVDFPKFFPADSITSGRGTNYGGKLGSRGVVNPFAEQAKGYSEKFTSTVLATMTGEQKLDIITKGLSFKAMVSFKNWSSTSITRARGFNSYEVNSFTQLDDGSYDFDIARVGDYQNLSLSTSTGHTGDRWLHVQPSINYDRKFGKHHVGGLFLYNLKEFSLNAPAGLIASLPKRRIGFVGRATYSFDNRFLFETNFAYNGSENFAKGKRFGFFPSVGVGYVLSNENWFNSSVIDVLKIKGSWGRVGNDAIGSDRFPYVSKITLNGRSFTTGIDQNIIKWGPAYDQFENRSITWETADKYNLGIDVDMFEGVHLNLDFYYEKRVDIFDDISSTIPSIFGTAGTKVFANVGEVSNRGVDFSIDFNKRFTKDFSFNAKGTFTYAHNTIDVNNEPAFSEFPNLSRVGQSVGVHLGYDAERLFIDDAEVDASPTQQIGGEKISPGDIKYTDITGDGKITSDDRKHMGNPRVPEIIYGLSMSANYKNWDISALFQGAAKTSLMMSNFHPFGTLGLRNVLDWVANDRYNPDNPDIYAGYPKLSKKDNGNNTAASSYWLRDGSFLKLRSAEIGYNYKQVRIFVSGFNLITFSKFTKWDPEEGGGSGLKYPTQRMINVGIQMRFN